MLEIRNYYDFRRNSKTNPTSRCSSCEVCAGFPVDQTIEGRLDAPGFMREFQSWFRSIVIRKSGCSRGLRLIDLESLNAFLEREAEAMHSPVESPDPGKEEKAGAETCCSH